jgi:hypothetical protein
LREFLGRRRAVLITPDSGQESFAAVPSTEDMTPVGAVMTAVMVGGWCIAISILFLQTIDSLLLRIALAAIIGLGGGLVGWRIGRAIDRRLFRGLPTDEIFVYQDALRQGRSVVVALVRTPEEDRRARQILGEGGAETVDAARHQLDLGLRDVEDAEYAEGRDRGARRT